MVKSQVMLRVPGRTESGPYAWQVVLLDDNGNPVGQAVVGNVQITAPPRVMVAPMVSHRLETQLGDWVALLGFDAPESVKPGQPLLVTLVWQALAETETSYKVFVHLRDAAGQVVAQSDAVPADWSRSTAGWAPGEFVTDAHTVALGRNLPPGEYRLAVGLYNTANSQRLLAPDGRDTIELAVVQIVK